jgi:FAD synthetase
MIRVLVFGTFDGVHEGHRNMLRQAKELGDYLVVVVAPDNVVAEIKGRVCVRRSGERIQGVRDEHIADEVVLGDKLLDNWSVLKKYKPDIIALGYDQDELKAALAAHFENSEKKPKLVILKAFKPDQYKSSLLNS